MAIVERFDRVEKTGRTASRAEGGWCMAEIDGKEYLVLESYGSEERKFKGDASQYFHLNRASAAHLRDLLERQFPGI